jgi:hypothetical protein
MPTPEGQLTTSQLWSGEGEQDAINNQAVEETQENITSEASDATEQEVG